MPKLSLNNWEDNNELDGLLFFAQTIRDMVSRYTIDSYKAPVFNSHSICDEVLDVIDEMSQGFLHEKGLDPIKDELIWNFKNDPVVKAILGYRFSPLIEELKQAESPKKVQFIVRPIQNLIERKYLEETHNQLKKFIKTPKEKERITQLSKIFISELVFYGYSQEYIYQETMRYFFLSHSISNLSQIEPFLKKFSFQEEMWDVYFKGSSNFFYLKNLDIFKNLEIIEGEVQPRKGYPAETSFFENNQEFPLYLYFTNITAIDPYDAKEQCENILQHLNDLSGLSTHKERLSWFPQTIVYSKSDYFTSIDDFSIMHRIKDKEICEIKDNIDDLVSILFSMNNQSMYLIWNSLSMHSVATQSNHSENQLMNLWTALETLLPSPPDQRIRITHFLYSFEPFLGRKYIQKLIKDLLSELRFELGGELDNILQKVPAGATDFEKLSAILSISEYKPFKEELCEKVGNNLILRNKVFRLNKKLLSKEKILDTIESHNQRVRWQLQRIYRARNLIVHKGDKLRYVDQLVENLHSYYHSIMSLIQEIQDDYDNIESLDTIFKLVRIEHTAHLNLLKKENQQNCNPENFQLLLFCNPK